MLHRAKSRQRSSAGRRTGLIVGLVAGRHDGDDRWRMPLSDAVFALFYGLVPLVLLLAAGAPWWAVLTVSLASAIVGFFQN